jgi:hypothetical protein
MPIRHIFVSQKQDGADPSVVRPSDWNADHIVEAIVVSSPPPGGKAVTNVYVNADGKLVIDYDDGL